MESKELLSVARALLEQPTAPFHEEAVRDEIVAQLRECPHVKIEHDAYGNMIAHCRRRTRVRPRWVFAAHIDHPGWVREKTGPITRTWSGCVAVVLEPAKSDPGTALRDSLEKRAAGYSPLFRQIQASS